MGKFAGVFGGGGGGGLSTKFGGHDFGGQIDPRRNAEKAANAQEDWINQAARRRGEGLQNAMARWGNYYAPYSGFGAARVAELDKLYKDPSSIRNMPGYKFNLGQGTEALENSAAARGGLLSGNTGKALTEYGQNYADKFYGDTLARTMSGAQFGHGADSEYANAMAALEADLGMSDSDKYGDYSRYAFWHEQQGMDEAKQWMSWLRGGMGGMGGKGGGGMGGMGGGK